MLMVVIALLPATFFGIYNFRHEHAWVLVVVTTLTAVATEYIYERLMHKTITIKDFSAVVTGLLLALNLSPTLPVWMGALGSIFAILVVKQLFGGLGQNFMNPALGARCFLLISFTGKMTYFVYDGVTGATPLAELKAGETVNTMNMLIGNIRGTIGETSVLAIMIGAMFLILLGIIDLRIPGTYIVTFVIFISIFGGHGFDPQFITAHLCGGGLMLGAWFMATDYVTSPITKSGQIVYGICLGVLTGLFRLFGGSAEGVSYAIIISNLLVPLIEKVTLPKPFGADTFVNEDSFKENKAQKILNKAGYDSDDISEVVAGQDASGETVGYVITVTSHEGYGGDIQISVGIETDGTVKGIEMLSISETAGLGMKATEADFKDQFKDKKVEKFSYTKSGEEGDDKIDALSGATITTNAVTNAVDSALVYFQEELGGSVNE